jgi:3-deoxy-D-manno-octulosonic-acid transferase
MYEALRRKHPELRLAMVPRHPEVVPRVVEAIKRAGLTPVLRTERPDGEQIENGKWKMEKDEVFVLNTMGELRKLYALAFAVFVGRSLIKKGGGGSDMIEVAALGKPCCFGPYTANFAEVVEMLTRETGAVEVKTAADLTRVVGGWLADPAAAAAMGRRAQELIRTQQEAHATDRYVERILQLVR